MSLLIALLVAQAAPVVGAVPDRSPKLDAANDCLVAKTRQWLENKAQAPDQKARWEWAQVITKRCDKELEASIQASSARNEGLIALQRAGGGVGVSRRDMLRSEALYYVDGMIAEHFEAKAQ